MKRAVAVAVALTGIAVAGCDSEQAPPSVPPPVALGLPADPGGSGGAPGSAGKALRGCDLITAPDLARLTGATDVKSTAQDGKGSAGCSLADSGKGISVLVLGYNYPVAKFGDPRKTIEASMNGGPPPRTVPGVGDLAEISGTDKSATLATVHRVGDYFRVAVLQGTSKSGLPWGNVLPDLGRSALRAMQ